MVQPAGTVMVTYTNRCRPEAHAVLGPIAVDVGLGLGDVVGGKRGVEQPDERPSQQGVAGAEDVDANEQGDDADAPPVTVPMMYRAACRGNGRGHADPAVTSAGTAQGGLDEPYPANSRTGSPRTPGTTQTLRFVGA